MIKKKGYQLCRIAVQFIDYLLTFFYMTYIHFFYRNSQLKKIKLKFCCDQTNLKRYKIFKNKQKEVLQQTQFFNHFRHILLSSMFENSYQIRQEIQSVLFCMQIEKSVIFRFSKYNEV